MPATSLAGPRKSGTLPRKRRIRMRARRISRWRSVTKTWPARSGRRNFLRSRLRPLAPDVDFVEGPEQFFETWIVLDRPGAIERRPEQLEIVLRQKAEGNDALVVIHAGKNA